MHHHESLNNRVAGKERGEKRNKNLLGEKKEYHTVFLHSLSLSLSLAVGRREEREERKSLKRVVESNRSV